MTISDFLLCVSAVFGLASVVCVLLAIGYCMGADDLQERVGLSGWDLE